MYLLHKLNFKPTKLMVRMIVRDDNSKIYYLHKTTTNNSLYQGSGVTWKKYLKKYSSILVWESDFYTDVEQLQKDAIKLSIEHNIVDSKQWANDKIENGLDGALPGGIPWNKGKTHSEEAREKMRKPRSSTKNMQKPKSASHKKSLSKSKVKYIYVIEGIKYYEGETKTAESLGLNLNTFKDRIRSKSKTFKEWYKIPMK